MLFRSRVTKVGSAVTKFKTGDLAAVGCLVDADRTCDECKAGLEQFCPHLTLTYNSPDKHIGGVTYGGYSEGVVVDERFVLRVPPKLDLAGAAPLLCAGITTFNVLRNCGARPDDVVAVPGLGGRGPPGGAEPAGGGSPPLGISRAEGKEAPARALGAAA